MLHIATVHWKHARWIDVQLDYLRRHVTVPYRVYAFLNDIPDNHRSKFHYTSTQPINSHAVKLNFLADVIAAQATDASDLLLFLDGDAFPIGDVVSFACPKLEAFPLLAIQRLENNGDIQPHPSFCLTTVSFWRSIRGDWRHGHTWKDADGKATTDVGGNLLSILQGKTLPWYPMLRTNVTNLHPVWFGLYENLVYHHGAGFRDPISRADQNPIRQQLRQLSRWEWILLRALERMPWRWFRHYRSSTYRQLERETIERNRALSQSVFTSLCLDRTFYKQFQ